MTMSIKELDFRRISQPRTLDFFYAFFRGSSSMVF